MPIPRCACLYVIFACACLSNSNGFRLAPASPRLLVRLDCSPTPTALSPGSAPTFDLPLAVALAGYSFEAYNDASTVGKVARGLDDTIITFCSIDLIKRAFSGVILGTLCRAEFNSQFTEQFTERLISGDSPDAYVDVYFNDSSARVIDSYRTSIKKDTKPVWNETFSVYVESPKQASSLVFKAYDSDVFKADDLIGAGKLPWRAISIPGFGNWRPKPSKETPIALYLEEEGTSISQGWLGRLFRGSPRRRRTGTVFANIQYASFQTKSKVVENRDKDPTLAHKKEDPLEEATTRRRNLNLPSGATPGMSWRDLLSKMLRIGKPLSAIPSLSSATPLLASLGNGTMTQMSTIENSKSDTQATLWADFPKKQLVISFRGTEQIKVKDILTDINLSQVPFHEEVEELKAARVHAGFYSAFKSIVPSVLQLLSYFFKHTDEGSQVSNKNWTIYVTGHSLGGALATLMSFEMGRLRAGLYRSDDTTDPALPYFSNPSFLSNLKSAEIVTYSFGTPRTGCPEFARLYDSLCPKTFRIVNGQDLVARVPRSSRINRVLQYEHPGKTVLISDGQSEDVPFLQSSSTLWIEGVDSGMCPLRDLSPFASTPSEQEKGALTMLTESLLATGISAEGTEQLASLYESLRDVSQGVDATFVQREKALLQSLLDGTGLLHHLEPSYYEALCRANVDANGSEA